MSSSAATWRSRGRRCGPSTTHSRALRAARAQRAARHARPRGRDRRDVLRRAGYAAAPAACATCRRRLSLVPLLFARRAPARRRRSCTARRRATARCQLGIEVNVLPAAIEACRRARRARRGRSQPPDAVDVRRRACSTRARRRRGRGRRAAAAHAPVAAGRRRARPIGERVAGRVGDGATLQLGIGARARRDARRARPVAAGCGCGPRCSPTACSPSTRAGALDPRRTRSPRRSCSARRELLRLGRRQPAGADAAHRDDQRPRPDRPAAADDLASTPRSQVDLFGQANASRINARIHSGFGGQTDFIVGALHSAGRPGVHRAAVVAPQGRRVDDRAAASTSR